MRQLSKGGSLSLRPRGRSRTQAHPCRSTQVPPAHQLPPPRSPKNPFSLKSGSKAYSFDPISHLPPYPILLKALREAATSLSAASTHQPLNSSQRGKGGVKRACGIVEDSLGSASTSYPSSSSSSLSGPKDLHKFPMDSGQNLVYKQWG